MAEPTWDEWLATRPVSIQKLAAEFPLGSTFAIRDTRYYLLGYNEADMLIVSPISPSENYDAAVRAQEYVCAVHLREGVLHG